MWVVRLILVCALVLAVGGRASGQIAVDLQVVLAVDSSGSVDQHRSELQKRGYAVAFRNPRVLRAIRSAGAAGTIAVTMVQWTGPQLHLQVVPWMLVRDEASIDALAAAIEMAPRQLFGGGTSISGAIDYAMQLFPASPSRGTRRVIDISGDRSNNSRRLVTLPRHDAVNSRA